MAPTPEFNVTLDQARAFWCARQGLGTPKANDPVESVAATGWARTIGGIDVYVNIGARSGVLNRSAVDDAVRSGGLRVIPAVRGCIYLVPEQDVGVVMALAADLARPRMGRDFEKAGTSWKEVEEVGTEVLKALANGPLTTTAIRKALPEGTVRSLGDAGKKVGVSSPLPPALRELEFRTEITRMPIGGRLDTERYEWRLSESATSDVPNDPAARRTAVVKRFFDFFAPAAVNDVAAWIGISKRDTKAAISALPLVCGRVEGYSDEAWIPETDVDALKAVETSSTAASFLPFEDNLMVVYGGPGRFAHPSRHDHTVRSWGRTKPTPLGTAKHLADRPLVLGHELAGFWEYDAENHEVVVGTFEKDAAQGLEEARQQLADFFRDDLGHARSFSLDSDDAVRERAAALRAF